MCLGTGVLSLGGNIQVLSASSVEHHWHHHRQRPVLGLQPPLNIGAGTVNSSGIDPNIDLNTPRFPLPAPLK